MNDRVVITGIGTINALGLSVKETWENAVNGVSGVAPITLFDPSELLVQIACEVKDFIPEIYMSVRQARRRDRFQQFASVAAKEAIDQAGLDILGDRGCQGVRKQRIYSNRGWCQANQPIRHSHVDV